MISINESLLIASAVGVFTLGGLFGVAWWALLNRILPPPRKHSCPHCGDTRVRFLTDWHAETVKDEEGLSQTAEEFICTECHKTHWV